MIVRPDLGSLPNSRSFRGQPLAIMLVVFAFWFGLRASFWFPPIAADTASMPLAVAGGKGPETGAANPHGREGSPPRQLVAGSENRVVAGKWSAGSFGIPAAPPPLAALAVLASGVGAGILPLGRSLGLPGKVQASTWNLEQTATGAAALPLPPGAMRSSEPRRLSIDGWLFLREGGAVDAGTGPLAPTYGRSQLGAVLRYGIAPLSPYLPQAYLRASGAIDSREADLAAGISVRPVPALPLRAHGEIRLSRLGDRTALRPSAFVTAGIEETLAPIDLRVRGYAQAGYVAGEFATGFADGSLVVERDAIAFSRGALALGAGAWGGVQEGASRFDLGPTASVNLRIGQGRMRVAADYRFRVAGDADPSSGAALTLSTSF